MHLLAAIAAALIVPQQSMAGVRLDMTQAQVRSALGAPTRIVHGKNEFSDYTDLVYPSVTVSFQGNARVTGMSTSSKALRTARGIGVGSTVWEVLLKVPSVKCERIAGYASCHVGEFVPGKVVTDFDLRDGRVSSVTLGSVID